jgi:hypothetical protein
MVYFIDMADWYELFYLKWFNTCIMLKDQIFSNH